MDNDDDYDKVQLVTEGNLLRASAQDEVCRYFFAFYISDKLLSVIKEICFSFCLCM